MQELFAVEGPDLTLALKINGLTRLRSKFLVKSLVVKRNRGDLIFGEKVGYQKKPGSFPCIDVTLVVAMAHDDKL